MSELGNYLDQYAKNSEHFKNMMAEVTEHKTNKLVCIPIKPGFKSPDIKGWTELKETDLDMFDKNKHVAVGLACGKHSGVTCVDVDNFEMWENLLYYYSDLSAEEEFDFETCPQDRTPSGGAHYFFKYNPELKNTVNSIVVYDENHKKIQGFVDVRTDGGQVVIPPSKYSASKPEKKHLDGKPYTWEVSFDSVEYQFKDIPEWLLELLKQEVTLQYIDGQFSDYVAPVKRPAPVTAFKSAVAATPDGGNYEEFIAAVIGKLNADRADPFDSWRNVLLCLKNIEHESGIDLRDIAHDFSERSKKYDECAVDSTYDKITVRADGEKKLGVGSLIYWLKEDNPAAYATLRENKTFNSYFQNGTSGTSGNDRQKEPFVDPLDDLSRAIIDSFSEVSDKKCTWETRKSPSLITYNDSNDDDVYDLLVNQMKHKDWMPNPGNVKAKTEGKTTTISFGKKTTDRCMISGSTHEGENQFVTYHHESDGKYRAYYKCSAEQCKDIRILMLAPGSFAIKKVESQTLPNTFNIDDPYNYTKFRNEFNQHVFDSKDAMIQTLSEKYPRVCAYVLDPKGALVLKGREASRMFTKIDDVGAFTNFKMFYYTTVKNERVRKTITFKDFITSHTTALERMTCKMDPAAVQPDAFNTWVPFLAKRVENPTEETKNGLELLKSYFMEVIACNDVKIYNYVMSWLRALVDVKVQLTEKMIILVSKKQGTGKSTFADFVSEFLLRKSVHVSSSCSTDPVVGEFNKHLEGKRLIIIDELSAKHNEYKNEWNKLKKLITDKTLSVHEKGQTRYDTDNVGNYFASTNYTSGIFADPTDRRLVVLEVSDKYTNDIEYFDRLRNQAFNQDVGDAFYTYLMDFKDRVCLRNSPVTKIKQAIQDASKPTVALFLDAFKNCVKTYNGDVRARDPDLTSNEILDLESNDFKAFDVGSYEEYYASDPYQHFTAAMIDAAKGNRVRKTRCYDMFLEWCQETHMKPCSQISFSKYVCTELKTIKSSGIQYYKLA